MTIVSSSGHHHIRLTVTDIDRSKAFYDEVFGFAVVADQSTRVKEPGVTESKDDIYGGVVYQTPSGMVLGLRPVAPGGQVFDSEHVGLDHLSFAVGSRDELIAAAAEFEHRGVPHGEVTDLAGFGIAILSFSDPDGIHLELTAPLPA
jgi:glyoxylase I family protein